MSLLYAFFALNFYSASQSTSDEVDKTLTVESKPKNDWQAFLQLEKRFYSVEKGDKTSKLEKTESSIQKILLKEDVFFDSSKKVKGKRDSRFSNKSDIDLQKILDQNSADVLALSKNYSESFRADIFQDSSIASMAESMCQQYADAYKFLEQSDFISARFSMKSAADKRKVIKKKLLQ
jgi:hypothetical protein